MKDADMLIVHVVVAVAQTQVCEGVMGLPHDLALHYTVRFAELW